MSARAQTTIDFAVGMGTFLLVVVFVFGFLSSLFAPFDASGGTSMIAADRSADRLVNDLLVTNNAEPSRLSRACTVEFFDGDGSLPSACGETTGGVDAGSLETALLGAPNPTKRLNVSVENDDGVRTLDGTRLAAGPEPPVGGDVIVASRTVSLAREQYRLYVRVW